MKALTLGLVLLSSVTSFAATNCNVKEITFDSDWAKKYDIHEVIGLLEAKGYNVDLNSPTAQLVSRKDSTLRFIDSDFNNKYQDISFSFYADGNLPSMQEQGSDFWLWDIGAKIRNRLSELGTGVSPVVVIENASDLLTKECGPYSGAHSCKTEGVIYSYVKQELFRKKGKRVGHDRYFKNDTAMAASISKLVDSIPACADLGEGKNEGRKEIWSEPSSYGYP